MNTPLRRVGLAILAMIVVLLANATYIQIVKADDYRKDARNTRVLYEEYARQRGRLQIPAEYGGQVIAGVTRVNDRLRYLRQYENGPLYAPVTGYYSVRYGATGLERTEDEILNGSDDRLFVRRLSDLITGRDPRGGNVVTTINPPAQQAAYEALAAGDYNGSVVALRPQTGEILAMVSTPSFDPNLLAVHDPDAQEQAYTELRDNPRNPMLNRATRETYFPGSTFKLVIAAAALEDGKGKDTQLPAASSIKINANTGLANYNNRACGSGETASMETALQLSCNTAFAQLAHDLGEDKVREQAAKFGIGEDNLTVPMSVEQSCIGPKENGRCMDIVDAPALYQSGIGQRDVRLTTLQNAMITATIANGGVRMRPQLIKQVQAPDLTTISDYEQDRLNQAMSGRNAETLRDMMIKSEENTGGDGKVSGLVVASKTGTAEMGFDPKNTPPYAWYVAFAPADNPKIAVAVVVESQQVSATGGKVSAAIGRATINAALAGGI